MIEWKWSLSRFRHVSDNQVRRCQMSYGLALGRLEMEESPRWGNYFNEKASETGLPKIKAATPDHRSLD